MEVSLENNAKILPEYKITQPVALVFGTEMKGILQVILDFADEILPIPMYGFTRSFNVSVAASTCMYELKQKLIRSGIDYKLNEEKLLRIKILWAINSIRSGQQIFERFLKKIIWSGNKSGIKRENLQVFSFFIYIILL